MVEHFLHVFAPLLAKSDIYVGGERDLVHDISEFVVAQAARLAAMSPDIPRVDKKLL